MQKNRIPKRFPKIGLKRKVAAADYKEDIFLVEVKEYIYEIAFKTLLMKIGQRWLYTLSKHNMFIIERYYNSSSFSPSADEKKAQKKQLLHWKYNYMIVY